MHELTRRTFVQTAGALVVSAALPSLGVAQRSDGRTAYRFFSAAEASFVETAVERLIPAEPEWPGAGAAGVPNYIDLQLAGPYGAGDRLFLGGPIKPGLPGQGYQLGLTPAALYRTSLRAIGEQLPRRGLDFASAPAQEQDAFLSELEAGRLDLGGFSSAIFFETLLANTIEGYFGDPAYGGNRDMVSWRMVGFPGAYAAYLGVYTQHGIRFDREPLSMAHSHAHP
jgi:gluconate 2-dehydrogenase gamma chain